MLRFSVISTRTQIILFEYLPQNMRDRIEPIPYTDCWIWLGAVGNTGIPRINLGGGRSARPQLMIYQHSHGKVSKGTTIQSTCGNRLCLKHLTTRRNGTWSKRPKSRRYPKRTGEHGIYAVGPIRRTHGPIECGWFDWEWETLEKILAKKREDRYLASRIFGRMKHE